MSGKEIILLALTIMAAIGLGLAIESLGQVRAREEARKLFRTLKRRDP